MSLTLSKNKVWTFYKWCLFIVMLESLKVWFFWDLPIKFMIPLLFIPLAIVGVFLIPNFFSFRKKSVLIIVLLYLLSVIFGIRGNLNAYIGVLISTGGVLFFAGLKDNYKKDFLVFFSHIFSIIVGISLLGWVLFLLGVNLPNFFDTFGFSESRNEAQYQFQNYYVFLYNTGTRYSDLTQVLIPRFSSVLLEPGYFGIVLVILLYLNHFNLKDKFNIILLVALIFTFSLSGWLMGLITYVAYYLRFSNKKIITLISVIFFLWAFYAFFSSYNNGANAVNELILSRLEYDESKGTISGYNRTQESFDDWFETYFITSPDIFFGLDMYKVFGETMNVGWKVYMVNYGLVGLSLYLLFLFYPFYRYRNYEKFVLFFLYILIFARGHHVIYFAAFPILYLGGCAILKNQNR